MDIYVAQFGFDSVAPDGSRTIVRAGNTARVGHWLLERNPDAFRPLKIDWEVVDEKLSGKAAQAAKPKLASV